MKTLQLLAMFITCISLSQSALAQASASPFCYSISENEGHAFCFSASPLKIPNNGLVDVQLIYPNRVQNLTFRNVGITRDSGCVHTRDGYKCRDNQVINFKNENGNELILLNLPDLKMGQFQIENDDQGKRTYLLFKK